MCGRVKLEGDVSEIKIAFKIPPDYPAPNYAPSWNVAPTDSLPIVRYNAKEGHRALDLMRWGLVPYWAKDIKVSFANTNAMAETVYTHRPSATRSPGAAASCPSGRSMNGRSSTPRRSSPTPSRSPEGAS
jgi:putative SOS response-associated peptidase YedK